jgi:hypothetical protein
MIWGLAQKVAPYRLRSPEGTIQRGSPSARHSSASPGGGRQVPLRGIAEHKNGVCANHLIWAVTPASSRHWSRPSVDGMAALRPYQHSTCRLGNFSPLSPRRQRVGRSGAFASPSADGRAG